MPSWPGNKKKPRQGFNGLSSKSEYVTKKKSTAKTSRCGARTTNAWRSKLERKSAFAINRKSTDADYKQSKQPMSEDGRRSKGPAKNRSVECR